MRAELKIQDADTSTKQERKEMADWLMQQANDLKVDADDYASRFTAKWRPKR